MIRNVLKTLGSARLALLAGVGLPFLVAASAFAQQPAASPATQIPELAPGPAAPPAPAAQGEATTERVVVTGSYIPTAEEVTAAPLDTLTAQDLRRSGSSDVLNTLQKRNPSFVGPGNLGSTNANTAGGATQGGQFAQIRGFPSLVLYEGRRIADAAAISTGGFQFTDVGLFPAALISRIEVLKDGASALYGSEAVGGVINVFTKDDFQGVELGFRYGTTVDAGTAERRGYVVSGIGNGTTQVTAGMQYYEIDPLFSRERAYSKPAINLTTTYGGSVRSANTAAAPDGRYLPIGFDPLNWPGAPIANSPFDVAGVAPGAIPVGTGYEALPQYYRPSSGAEVLLYDIARIPTSTGDQQRTNVVASFSHQIFGKQLEMFGNFLYNYSEFEYYLNAQPLSNATGVQILGTQRVNPNFDPALPVGPANMQIIPEDRGPAAPFNPFELSIDQNTVAGPFRLVAANRYQGAAPRIFDNNNQLYRFLFGLRSQINENWMVETAGYYSEYITQFVNYNLVNALQLNAMIAGTATDLNGGPIPALDFFALEPIGTGPGQVTGEQFATVFGNTIRDQRSWQRVFDAKVVGFPFSLPAGKVGFSFGAEYRLEGFKVDGSPEIFVGSVPIQPIGIKRDIYSFFAEASIPIVSSAMKVPFVHNFEIGLAGRFDHYEGVSEDAKVPKVTVRYQPIKDLTLRGTWSDSFIAPNLYQTSGPSATGFSTTITLGGVTQDQAQVMTGSNPNLTHSNAINYTAGLVYSPSWLPGFVLTADYFRTLQQNIVGTLGGAFILNDVNNLGPASAYVDLVAFNNFPGFPGSQAVTAPGQLQGNLASVYYLDTNRNLGAQRVEGFDLSARYNMDLHSWGQFEIGGAAIVFTKTHLKRVPFGSEYYNIQGLDFPEGGGAFPDYKITALAEYRWQGFTLTLNATYVPELLNAVGADPEFDDQSTYVPIDDFYQLDGRLSYTFVRKPAEVAAPEPKDYKSTHDSKNTLETAATVPTLSVIDRLLDGLTLTVGCNNMTDQQPPFILGANSNTDLSVYDPFGQFVYFEVSKKF